MDLTAGILLTVIGLVIGVLVGILVSGMRKGETAETPSGETLPTADLVEVTRLWRDRRSGRLVVEVNKRQYKVVGDLNPVWRDRLRAVSSDLRTWLGIFPGESPANAAPAEQPPSGLKPDQPVQPELTVEASRPGINPMRLFARAIQEMDKPKIDLSPASIAAQIDEILQRKLEDSPLEGRSIRLMELPGQGMVVMVGLDKYDDVDAVPDQEARRLIREAVAEWEKTSIPD